MRADERKFLVLLILEQARPASARRSTLQIIRVMTALHKMQWRRALGLLQKYSCRGWYRYGLVPWDGEFTESGLADALRTLRAEEKNLWPAEFSS